MVEGGRVLAAEGKGRQQSLTWEDHVLEPWGEQKRRQWASDGACQPWLWAKPLQTTKVSRDRQGVKDGLLGLDRTSSKGLSCSWYKERILCRKAGH